MTTTFIDYREDIGFWIEEIYMEIVFEYIDQSLETYNGNISFREDLDFDLNFNTTGLSKGMLTLTWDSFLNYNYENEQTMISILESTKDFLTSKGQLINSDELNILEKKKESEMIWKKSLKISEVLKIIDALILMLKNEWQETNYDMKID